MRPSFREVSLAALKRDVWQDVDEASDLTPARYALMSPILYERVNSRVVVVDGRHRAAGLISWAEGEEHDLRQVMVEALDVTGCDEELVARAGDGFARGNEAAVRKLIALAR